MRISSSTRNAVRFVFEVARLSDGSTPVNISEIARVTGISNRYLGQLAIELKSHYILKGVCGRNGGYILSRPAETITIGNIIKATSGDIRITDSSGDIDECQNNKLCSPRDFWFFLQRRIEEVVNRYTIADLIEKEKIEEIDEGCEEKAHLEVDNLQA